MIWNIKYTNGQISLLMFKVELSYCTCWIYSVDVFLDLSTQVSNGWGGGYVAGLGENWHLVGHKGTILSPVVYTKQGSLRGGDGTAPDTCYRGLPTTVDYRGLSSTATKLWLEAQINQAYLYQLACQFFRFKCPIGIMLDRRNAGACTLWYISTWDIFGIPMWTYLATVTPGTKKTA